MLPTTASESGKRPPAPKPWSARKTVSSGIPQAPPHPAEQDPRADRDAAQDLQPRDLLGEDGEREDRGDERLQVREERRAGGTDAVDRPEPEDVRQDERAEQRVAEADPVEPADRTPVLRRELARSRGDERHPADEEDDGADLVRRVAAHERRDDHRVRGPRRGRSDREHVARDVAGDSAAGPG